MMEVIEKQIAGQIEGCILITAHFDDVKSPEFMEIYHQAGGYWLKVAFQSPKQISASEHAEIVAMFTGEQKFNADDEVIRQPSFDGFFNQYYN